MYFISSSDFSLNCSFYSLLLFVLKFLFTEMAGVMNLVNLVEDEVHYLVCIDIINNEKNILIFCILVML